MAASGPHIGVALAGPAFGPHIGVALAELAFGAHLGVALADQPEVHRLFPASKSPALWKVAGGNKKRKPELAPAWAPSNTRMRLERSSKPFRIGATVLINMETFSTAP